MTSKRDQILQAALELLTTRGFHGTSVQMIADQVGMATGSFYRYFPSKEALIGSLYRQCIDMMVDGLTEDVDLDDISFPTYRKLWFTASYGIKTYPEIFIFRDLYERSPFFSDEDKDWSQNQWLSLKAFFEAGTSRGIFLNIPSNLLMGLSLGTVYAVMYEQRIRRMDLSDELKEQMAAASWKAILAEHISQTGSKE